MNSLLDPILWVKALSRGEPMSVVYWYRCCAVKEARAGWRNSEDAKMWWQKPSVEDGCKMKGTGSYGDE